MNKLWTTGVFLILISSGLMAQSNNKRYCIVTVQFSHIAFTTYGYRMADVKIDSSTMHEREDSAIISKDLVMLKNKNSTAAIFNYLAQRGWAFAGSTSLVPALVQYQFKKED